MKSKIQKYVYLIIIFLCIIKSQKQVDNGDEKEFKGQQINCQFKSDKLGFVTQLEEQDDNSPVEIVSKTSYVELDRYELKIYQDDDKIKITRGILVSDIKRIIFPQSFNQKQNQVDCFQIQTQNNYQGQLIKDTEVIEPIMNNEDNSVITLCFKNTETMNDWYSNIKQFKDGCKNKQEINSYTLSINQKESSAFKRLKQLTTQAELLKNYIQQTQLNEQLIQQQLQKFQKQNESQRLQKVQKQKTQDEDEFQQDALIDISDIKNDNTLSKEQKHFKIKERVKFFNEYIKNLDQNVEFKGQKRIKKLYNNYQNKEQIQRNTELKNNLKQNIYNDNQSNEQYKNFGAEEIKQLLLNFSNLKQKGINNQQEMIILQNIKSLLANKIKKEKSILEDQLKVQQK